MTTLEHHASRLLRATGRTTHASRVAAARGLILVAAVISFFLSVSLWFLGYREEGLFVGIWVPTILSLGAFLVPGRAER